MRIDPRRELLLDLLQAALAAVDGRGCTRAALAAAPGGPLWLAAIGKAAAAMALGAHDACGTDIERTLVITKDGHVEPRLAGLAGAEILHSGHPVPDERSLAAGSRLLEFVAAVPAGVQPLFLVSGGASALVEVPAPGLTLADLQRLNREGLAGGANIGELNRRRAAVSQIKGGRLAARLGGRPGLALFISDVPGDDPAVIGSGLLAAPAQGDGLQRRVIARVEDAMQAVRGRAGALSVEVAGERFAEAAERVAVRCVHELHLGRAQVQVWGGESVVQLPPVAGRGGRSQHLALTAARLMAGEEDLLLLAAGTDGTDGPTPDAGAIVDGGTAARAAAAGFGIEDCLRRADAGSALEAAGDLLHTGPTGTNVGDLVIGLKLPPTAVPGRRRGGSQTTPARMDNSGPRTAPPQTDQGGARGRILPKVSGRP